MESQLSPDTIRAAARLIDLPLTDAEVEPVQERLEILLAASKQVRALVDDTSDPDMRYDARWEVRAR